MTLPPSPAPRSTDTMPADPHAALEPCTAATFEDLTEVFLQLCKQGLPPDVDEVAERHPQWAAKIRELFPTIATMEALRVRKEARRADGRASLGSARIRSLGDLQIIREIGRGGMGVVYEAFQESLRRRVAVKVLPRQLILDPKQVARFRREAEMAAQLHHPHIVPVFGVGESEGFHYYVMQLIDGVGLDQLLNVHPRRDTTRMGDATSLMPGPPPELDQAIADKTAAPPPLLPDTRKPAWAAKAGIQVARALQYAHRQGVLHRDVKPGNLLLDRDQNVLITDFGLATWLNQESASQTGHVVGTLRYMAPEQFGGKADERTDVYSLGVTLYEFLTGRPAFAGDRTSELIDQIRDGRLEPPRRINPRIPRDLETILLKATAREPERRYPSARALANDLEHFLHDRPIRARRASPLERLWRWSRRNSALAAVSACALILACISVALAVGYVRLQAMRGRDRWERPDVPLLSRVAQDPGERTPAAGLSDDANPSGVLPFEFNPFDMPPYGAPLPRGRGEDGPRPPGPPPRGPDPHDRDGFDGRRGDHNFPTRGRLQPPHDGPRRGPGAPPRRGGRPH